MIYINKEAGLRDSWDVMEVGIGYNRLVTWVGGMLETGIAFVGQCHVE